MQSLPDDLTIERIESTIFRLPMRGALRWGSHGMMTEARHVLIEVTLSDGSTGVAEAPPRPTIYGETATSICAILREEIAPRLLHAPASSAPSRMEAIAFNHTARGSVDMALHDAVAHSRGLSLAQQLGALADSSLEVSYILGIGSLDEVLAEAHSVVDRGVRVLKVKVGKSYAEDIAHIDEMQRSLPATVRLYADANECLTAENAPAVLAQLRERGLLYCEEPLPVELVRERAQLRARDLLPLIADDSAFTLRDLRRELALDTFDVLNIKTARTGYTQSEAMRSLAHSAGKAIMVGSQASAGLGAARAGVFAAIPGIDLPCELTFFLKLTEDIVDRPIPIVDGFVRVSDLLALTVTPERLSEMRVD
jgi:L-Ala-D/L-Glu epimerase